MSDIGALFLMRKQKNSHKKFQIPNSSDQYDTFQEEVLQTTKNTSDVIQQVNNYVALIKKEMHQLRMTVEVFNADLAKQMRTLISNLKANTDSKPDPPSQRRRNKNGKGKLSVPVNLPTGTTASGKELTGSEGIGDRPPSNTNFEKKIDEKEQNSDNLKKIAALQKISDEQNELRKMMMIAANMANELENEGKISLEGLLELRKGVNKYAENLESADVEYARKKDEKRREEEEAKRQREEENRRKEADKKAAEEERLRQEKLKAKIKEDEDRKQKEEKEKKKQLEEEKRKKEQEEEEARKAEEEERKRKAREEKHKQEEEERRRLELEARKKEEERKQKELEEKRKKEEEEEKIRKEEEENKRRRDWRNWAPMIYYRQDGTTANNDGMICIALAMEGEITQDDLTCYASDGNKEREKCLQQDKREIPISPLVTVKPSTKSALRLQEPIRIFIPHQANRGYRELIVRASIDGGTWKIMKHESGIPPQVDLEDIPMIQTAINNFKSVGIIVASRPKMHAFTLGRDGGTVETGSPNKAILTAPNGCFSEKTNGSIQITDIKHSTEMANDVDDLRNAQAALTPHTITLDKKSKSNLTLEVYPELKRRVTRSQSALKACENIMIKNMDAEKLADILYGKGTIVNSSTLQEIKKKKLPEDKAMALLEKLKFCDEDQFQDLVDSLEESKQQTIANELKKALEDIENSELGCDFVDASEDKVALLSCKNGEGWTVVDFDNVEDVPGACRLQLLTGGKSYSVVGLIVPKSTKDSELSRMAELFYTSSEQFRMRLIVKQHSENKYRLAIRCVNPEMFSTTMAELRNMSFTNGPSESFEFNVKEGETIWLQLLGNRKFVSQQSPEVHFKVYLSSIYSMDLRISETKGKESTSKLRNDLQYNVGLIEQRPPRHGVFKLQL